MTKHIFVYQPTASILRAMDDFGTEVVDWGDEKLFKLSESPYENDTLNDWLHDTAYTSDAIIRYRSLDDPTNRVFFDDLYDDNPFSSIVSGLSPGGDVRKYINTRYAVGGKRAIDCKLRYTCFPDITGFEPLELWAVEQLLADGVCSAGMNDNPYYPSAERLLRWGDIVRDKWGCRTGVLGTLHFDDVAAGFDGFVIYDADETIRDWAAERWTTNPDFPYMRPDEFSLDNHRGAGIESDTALRIWFD